MRSVQRWHALQWWARGGLGARHTLHQRGAPLFLTSTGRCVVGAPTWNAGVSGMAGTQRGGTRPGERSAER
jgi:hypothetical protein